MDKFAAMAAFQIIFLLEQFLFIFFSILLYDTIKDKAKGFLHNFWKFILLVLLVNSLIALGTEIASNVGILYGKLSSTSISVKFGEQIVTLYGRVDEEKEEFIVNDNEKSPERIGIFKKEVYSYYIKDKTVKIFFKSGQDAILIFDSKEKVNDFLSKISIYDKF